MGGMGRRGDGMGMIRWWDYLKNASRINYQQYAL